MASGSIPKPFCKNKFITWANYAGISQDKIIFSEYIEYRDYDGMLDIENLFLGKFVKITIEKTRIVFDMEESLFKKKIILGNPYNNLLIEAVDSLYGDIVEDEVVKSFDMVDYVGGFLRIFIGSENQMHVIKLKNAPRYMRMIHYIE